MLHLKSFNAVDQGIFYKVAKIHSDIFNTLVDNDAAKIEYIGRFWQN